MHFAFYTICIHRAPCIMADERDNIVVSRRVWLILNPDSPRYYRKKQHCPTCCDRLNTLKPTSANTISTMLGNVVPTCCVRLHGPLWRSDRSCGGEGGGMDLRLFSTQGCFRIKLWKDNFHFVGLHLYGNFFHPPPTTTTGLNGLLLIVHGGIKKIVCCLVRIVLQYFTSYF